MALLHEDMTEQIIGAAFEVYRILGYGFLGKVYQRAMQVELQLRGFKAPIEEEVRVTFKNVEVGFFRSDILVNGCIVVELKAEIAYNPLHEAQLLNELKATGIKVGLLVNFGRTKGEFKRFVF